MKRLNAKVDISEETVSIHNYKRNNKNHKVLSCSFAKIDTQKPLEINGYYISKDRLCVLLQSINELRSFDGRLESEDISSCLWGCALIEYQVKWDRSKTVKKEIVITNISTKNYLVINL